MEAVLCWEEEVTRRQKAEVSTFQRRKVEATSSHEE